MTRVPPSVVRVAAEFGISPVTWTRPECGLSAAERHVVTFSNGMTAFVKGATTDETAAWLRHEHAVLGRVAGRLGPEIIAWVDDPERPVLVTTDLSSAYWPAATGTTLWRDGDIESLLTDLARLRQESVDESLAPASWPAAHWADLIEGGIPVTLGLCSPDWLDRHAVELLRLDAAAQPQWTALVHGDVRSDNLCFLADGSIRLVDWSVAGRGHPLHDLLLVLPTLRLEGGPEPHTILQGPLELIVRFAGGTLSLAVGDRPMPDWLQDVLRRLAAIQLTWLGHLLGDPP